MSVVASAAAFLLIGTQPEEIGIVHQNEPLVRTAQAQAASAEPCPMIVDSQGEVQPPIMIGERPVEAGQSIDVPAEPGNTSEASPDEIIVIARGEAPPGDPLQNVNIEAFQVAQSVDKALVGPIAKGYEGGVPKPIRDGLGNALRNLSEPINFVNFLLQFKIGKALETVGRFAINSTIGAAGVFDVAKKAPINLPYRSNGFANTLGFYGVEPGPYFFLPLVGPTTLRDMVGDGIDLLVLPVSVGKPFNQTAYAVPTTVINRLNDRVARDAEIERLQEESADPYVETRSLYLEMRQREIDVLRGKGRDRAGQPEIVIPDTLVAPQASDPSADTASDCAKTLSRGTTLPIED